MREILAEAVPSPFSAVVHGDSGVFNTVPSQFTPRLLPVLQAVWKLEDPAVLARERQQREQEQVRKNIKKSCPKFVLPYLRGVATNGTEVRIVQGVAFLTK